MTKAEQISRQVGQKKDRKGHRLLNMVIRNKIFRVHYIQQIVGQVKNYKNVHHDVRFESSEGLDSNK